MRLLGTMVVSLRLRFPVNAIVVLWKPFQVYDPRLLLNLPHLDTLT